MLTLDDCIAFGDLTKTQLEAVAHHEHVPLIIAAEMMENIADTCEGCELVTGILRDEMKEARDKGDFRKVDCYRHALQDFLANHTVPDSGEGRLRPNRASP